MATIWTIGHSTRSLEELVSMLLSVRVECLVDVRSYPGSRKFPHFNKEALEVSIPERGIEYIPLGNLLGGRRKVAVDSKNTRWRHAAFRGYADHMETNSFQMGIGALERIATAKRTAFMCSEAVWWRCHRSMISDYLKCAGWTVLHITGAGKVTEHPYTEPALIVDGELRYF